MNLIIRDLTKTYPNGVKALNQINLTLEKGMFGLLGPNGAGTVSYTHLTPPTILRLVISAAAASSKKTAHTRSHHVAAFCF